MESIYIKGVKVSVCDLKSSVSEALNLAKSEKPAYICVTDAGNIVNAHRNSAELRNAINSSAISLPDGRPISMLTSLKGIEGMARVTGADFMTSVFQATSNKSLSHFFLGDTNETLVKLTQMAEQKFGVKVAGSYSPPFGELKDDTNKEIIRRINEAKPDFIWVSLGGGKQEIWMHDQFRNIDRGVMTGVGAAFRFLTGDIHRAPPVLQKSGLEWFYRLMQQPRKMAGRYARTLPFFALYFMQIMFDKNLKSN